MAEGYRDTLWYICRLARKIMWSVTTVAGVFSESHLKVNLMYSLLGKESFCIRGLLAAGDLKIHA